MFACLGFTDGGINYSAQYKSRSIISALNMKINQEMHKEMIAGTITLAAGEQRTCTVKNYIESVFPFD